MRILKEYSACKEVVDETEGLTVALDPAQLQTVLDYAKNFSHSLSLGKGESAALRSIVRDVFETLAKNTFADETVRITCKYYSYYYMISFDFAQTALPLITFNRTEKMLRTGSRENGEAGFMNVVHLVDRYDISVDQLTGHTRICMIKEKSYQSYEGGRELPPIQEALSVTKAADTHTLMDFAARLYEIFGVRIDTFLHTPELFVDTMSSGELSAVFLADPEGNCAGGAVWQQTHGLIMLMTICVFTEVGKEKLIGAFLQEVSQTDASYIVSQIDDSEMIAPYFDYADSKYRYKELRKTSGATSYVNPDLLKLLKKNYEDHGIRHDLKEISFTHNYIYPFSVLSAKTDVHSSEALLSILLVGDDLQSNILKHVTFLRKQGIEHIYLRLDLGVVDEALAADLILACGFEIQYLWPYSGKGDIVVFQYTANEYYERKHCDITPVQKGIYDKIPALVRRIYGDAYPFRYLYDPDALRKKIRGRLVYPYVALDNGEPCGMVSLVRSAPNAYIFELGHLMVVPEYRGTSIANDLIEFIYNKAIVKLDFDAVFVESVTNHRFSQRSANSGGFVDTALKLNIMSPDAFSLADRHRQGGRVSCVVAVRENADENFLLYLPSDYCENIRYCLDGLRPRVLMPSLEGLPQMGETSYEMSEDEVETSNTAVATITEIGADFDEVAEKIDVFAHANKLRSILINISFANEHIGGAVKVLRERGFFFGGVMPYWLPDSDALLMQKLYGNRPDWERIRLFSKRIKAIAEMIKKETEQAATISDPALYGKTAIERFSRMIQVKTDTPDNLPVFRELVHKMYPIVAARCAREIVGNEIIYLWKGKSSDSPAILMSHYDVAPVDETVGWVHPPFSGEVSDCRVWGRGALDTKCTLCAALEAAESLLSSGFLPENDIYFCFGGDEETDGKDAQATVRLLKERNVSPALVLDEGGAIMRGHVFGVTYPFALIGLAEKGYMDVEFIIRSGGGHTSVPPKDNPTSVMAEAIQRINANPFAFKMNDMSKALIATVRKHASFRYRFVFANFWLFRGFVKRFIRKKGHELDALSRTTGSVTMLEGSPAANVIPSKVRAVANFRIAYQSSVAETLRRIQDVLADLHVEINVIKSEEPSIMSVMDCDGFEKITSAIFDTWGRTAIFPYLMMASSDSRKFTEISEYVYRFSPIELNRRDINTIHGVNESIDCENFHKTIAFYKKLIRTL